MLWCYYFRSFYFLLSCHMIVWWCDHDSIIVWQLVMVTGNNMLDSNCYWTLIIFLFLLFYFPDFILIFFFFFSFGQWRGTWHCSHMTGHMMWHYRPRTWWKDLEDNIRAYIYNIVALRQTWGCSIDNRAGLIIGSTDQACFVYIGL